MILPIHVIEGDEHPDHHADFVSSSSETMSANPTRAANTVKVAAGYVLQQRLGTGSFASVYKGIRLQEYQQSVHNGGQSPPPPHSIAAIKAISRQSKKLTKKVLENLEIEIAILQTYRHPNICCLHDVQKTERHIYLVLEYCGGGDLQRLIRTRQKGRLSETLCRRLVRDLAAGLRFLWGKQVVHRDIKPQNLLLTGPLPTEEEAENPAKENARNIEQGSDAVDTEGFMLKIADFGFARHLTGVDLAETMCGSPLYMAPEILSGEKYDAKADLWSVGTVLFEMISGKTPFQGENHLDLLRNIKTKAVRLPADVRVSKECVKLLKLTLDRKPHSRTDFKGFLEASGAFVALGCNGTPPPEASTDSLNEMAFSSGEEIVDRGVCARMNLCAIAENDGLGESTSHHQQRDYQHVQQAPMTNYIPNTGSLTQMNAMNTIAQIQATEGKPGFVTPPFNAMPAPNQPPVLQTGLQTNPRRVSVFAPLQASPNISPSATPSGVSPPVFSLQGFVSKQVSSIPLPRPGVFPIRLQGSGPQQPQLSQPVLANNQTHSMRNSSPKTSIHESLSSDSGFVFVDHNGSKPCSGTNSPSTSGLLRSPELLRSPSLSPRSSSGRITILDAKNAGILATSPGTGRALVGKMMMGSPPGRSTLTPTTSNFMSPRTSLRTGGCLAHIETLARMLAASEDIGRRAITVAHLGDVRAYLAMGLLVAQRDEIQSSFSSCTPMEGVVEDRRNLSKRFVSRNNTIEEGDEDEFPFAMTTSSDEMSQSPVSNIMANLAPIIGNTASNSDNEESNEEMPPCMIEVHFREALECYVKTLSMMKGSIRAAQKVTREIEEVINNPSSRMTPDANNPYTPLRKRCKASLDWLQGQFAAVLERADAAEKQISKVQKANPTQQMEGSGALVCVQELIYNHSLKCGRDGAVKQLLGHYDAARSCYRSAGLLAETLLMESKVGEEDRSVLEGYVHCFADQIMELDQLIRVSRRSSSQSTAASTIKRLSSTGASQALTG